ncbi:Multimodular transpeptidase-transglycosylase (EC 2.4.1.129) (EC 3.4.-.-) [Oscillospiraceae bacterium]|nr:PBP1A family penicillin-binding protein [Bacillota bacterium]CAH0542338.1 Multimodular transpeptidase-transglycosylase (EC 2.4.1.129) (EC 3.4.-.-) [Oscillospiraceae bacterium]
MRADKNTQPSGSAARRILKGFGKVFGTMVLVLFLTTLIFACLFALYVKNNLSAQVDSIDGFTLDQTSVIYYEDPKTGQDVVLRKLYGGANRTWVKYEDIPKNLIHACIAIEDKRFEDHQGVDWVTTLKACVKMFLGRGEAGGSTITQQLVKNITGRDEVTVRRKLVEIFSALELEKKYTKKQIMELYLNVIALGENCEGVESASQVYFGKSVSELDLAECAALIGITNNPSIYDPYINADKNKERQVIILDQMLEQKYITQEQHDTAVAEELVLHNASGEASGDEDYYSYFEDQVINDVVRDLSEKTGYDQTIVRKMLMTGGYKIYSTLNPDVQAAVEEVYQNLDNIPNTASSQQLQSGIVIIDNKTGDVVAVAGGVGEKQGSLILNRATQSYLSPGSTIKPVSVYAPALELGLITPATVMDDTPYSFTDARHWPKNSDSIYRGLMNINEAVGLSINTIPVKLVAQMTPEYSFEFAKEKMGLSTLVSSYVNAAGDTFSDVDLAPLAMGGLTRGVTVKAMAQAYATFANEGVYREARTYTKVVDSDGKVVLDNTQQSHVAMKDMTAWYITYMLENTVESGTGTAAQIANMTVAGKTGTTTSDFDRWFAGYTPYYTGVVWCGYDDPEEVVLTDSSTNPAIVLWQKVMEQVHDGLPNKEFNKPTNVVECTVCRDSGLLMTDACREDPRGSRAVTVELSLYDVPTQNCDVHKEVEICGASGHVVNEYCKQVEGNTTKTVGLLDVSRAFPVRGITVQDQAYAVPNDSLPAGYYPALSPDVDAINVECYIHTRDDLPEPEAPEDEEEEDSASRISAAVRDILTGGSQND